METWRATLFGREGELAFVQTVPDPPPLVITVPVMRPVRWEAVGKADYGPWTKERRFELIWSAYPRADYRETKE